MASFYSDMDEIHRIGMETPDSSDGSWEYSSENETTDYSSPEEAENVNVVEEPRAATSEASTNHGGEALRQRPVRQ